MYVKLEGGNGGIVLNISEGGLALQAAVPLTDEQLTGLSFRFSPSDNWIKENGVIAWKDKSKKMAGVQFVDLSEESRAQIVRWISSEPSQNKIEHTSKPPLSLESLPGDHSETNQSSGSSSPPNTDIAAQSREQMAAIPVPAARFEAGSSIPQNDAPTCTYANNQQNCNSTPTILDFYGMREQPFGMTPDPAYFYASRTHREALASLSFGIKDNRGFMSLIAEPGMGKTTLLYQLLEELRDSARTVFLFQTQCNSREFLEYILHELNVDPQGMGLVAMHSKLNELLFEEMLAGKRFVLIVDEAQNLDDSVLETVRMLSNFENDHTKLLQIVLAGQPRLAAKLVQPQLLQLRQRIAVVTKLEPLSKAETALLVEHRLKVAGYCGEPIFEQNAVDLIAEQSHGIPRNINNICYNALLLSHTRGLWTVPVEIVREALAHLDIGSLALPPLKAADPAAISIAASLPLNTAKAGLSPFASQASSRNDSTTQLTYKPLAQVSAPRWFFNATALAGVLVLGSLLPVVLQRAEPSRPKASTTLGHWSLVNPYPSEAKKMTYSADPRDTEAGKVLTVIARPKQTLENLSLLYAGHFDTELLEEIRSLNPELTDPNHLEAGQLIRIPLPPKTLRKVNGTEGASTPTKLETLKSLFANARGFWRERSNNGLIIRHP
jgi:type II secretory pathway predicted ATPase ExeA